jgi:hypothetical protein
MLKFGTTQGLGIGTLLGVVFLSGCTGITDKPSLEQRILEHYSRVSQVRAVLNDRLAHGTINQDNWRIKMDQIDAAKARLDSSVSSKNRGNDANAEKEVAVSEEMLREIDAVN